MSTRAARFRWITASCSALFLVPLILMPVSDALAETAAEAAKRPLVGPKPARLADGHLNLTGFWVPVHGMLEVNIGLGGSSAGGLPLGPPPFTHFTALKQPYKDQLAASMKAFAAGKVADPVASCFPPGMPRMMVMVYGMDLLQTPSEIVMTSEWQDASRRIWMSQTTHTDLDELNPTYTGESIGHWEGDTLVVDTVGIRLDVPVNFTNLPHSAKLHISEKFTEKTPGMLVDEITIEDPDVFVAPWTETQTYRYRPDLRIEEFVCLENNRNVGAHGEAEFTK